MSNKLYLIAIDIGGTFTDLVLLNRANNEVAVAKVLTTYPDPSEAVLSGLQALLSRRAVNPAQVERLIHGTTLVTNAIIERKGSLTALLTTEGFRDALEIGKEGRYDIYDLNLVKPPPLVERRLRLPVPERINAQGQVLKPLDEAALRALCEQLRAEGIEAVAITFLQCLHESRPRATSRRDCPHPAARCLPLPVAPGGPRHARIPTHLDHRRQCLRPSPHRKIPAGARARTDSGSN